MAVQAARLVMQYNRVVKNVTGMLLTCYHDQNNTYMHKVFKHPMSHLACLAPGAHAPLQQHTRQQQQQQLSKDGQVHVPADTSVHIPGKNTRSTVVLVGVNLRPFRQAKPRGPITQSACTTGSIPGAVNQPCHPCNICPAAAIPMHCSTAVWARRLG